MSKKFTGITSAGSAIPVYDKDAHSALEQKLDTSAFSSVSGEFATVDDVVAAVSGKADTSAIPSLDGYATQEWVGEQGYLTEVPESAVSGFATHEEVESATSGKAATSGVVEYENRPSANPIYADDDSFYNVAGIYGSGVGINKQNLNLSGAVTANTGGFTANGITATNNDSYFGINSRTEVFSGGGGGGFQFSSENTSLGTAQLAVNYATSQTVQIPSPKFEARNASGAGFSIEASAAKGYDHNGNVVWDTTKPPAPSQLIAGLDSPKPNILLSPYVPIIASASFSSAPLLSADGFGIYIGISGQNIKAQMDGLTARNGIVRTESTDDSGNVIEYSYLTGHNVVTYHSSAFGSAYSGTWSLTGSVQKREIECDSATSAITAIAGSAVGGGSTYSAGANIDITDDVISGKDWSEDIASATSGLQPSGDYYSASNPSGFMTELPASATDVIDTVTANSGTWGGSALPISAGPGIKVNLVDNTLVFSNDETVLWSGAGSTTGSTINLNESLTHFEKYGLYYYIPYQESNQTYYQEMVYKPGQTVFGIKTDGINGNIWRMYCDWGTMTDTSISLVSGRQGGIWTTASPQEITWYDGSERHHTFTKVVGINRVSGGN